jgi:hypothetical protein
VGLFTEKIAQIMGGSYLSLLDGGSTATKVIAEFGVLGIIMLLAYARLVFRGISYIRAAQSAPARDRDKRVIFFQALVISYSLELLVRGVGYFSPGGFLALVALISLHRLSRSTSQPDSSNHARTAVQARHDPLTGT